jgi:hypothetical protein
MGWTHKEGDEAEITDSLVVSLQGLRQSLASKSERPTLPALPKQGKGHRPLDQGMKLAWQRKRERVDARDAP